MKTWKTISFLALASSLGACASLPRLAPAQDPLSVQEHITLGNDYQAKSENALARDQYQAALTKDPKNVPALLAAGSLAYQAQDWKSAEHDFERALHLQPKEPGAMNNLATVYIAENKHLDRAKKLVDEALPTAGPLIPYLLDTRANLEIREGQTEAARMTLDQAQSLAPANDPDFAKHIQETRERLAHPPSS